MSGIVLSVGDTKEIKYIWWSLSLGSLAEMFIYTREYDLITKLQ